MIYREIDEFIAKYGEYVYSQYEDMDIYSAMSAQADEMTAVEKYLDNN